MRPVGVFDLVANRSILRNPDDFSVVINNEKELRVVGLPHSFRVEDILYIHDVRQSSGIRTFTYIPSVHTIDAQVLVGGDLMLHVEEASFDPFGSEVFVGISGAGGGGGAGTVTTTPQVNSGQLLPGPFAPGYMTLDVGPAQVEVALYLQATGSATVGPMEVSCAGSPWVTVDPTVVGNGQPDTDYVVTFDPLMLPGDTMRIHYNYNMIGAWSIGVWYLVK